MQKHCYTIWHGLDTSHYVRHGLHYITRTSARVTVQRRTRTHIDAERASRSTYAVPAPPRNRHQRAQLEELERIAPLMVSWLQAQGSRAAATREKAAMSACVARSRQTAGSIPYDALC